MRAVPRAVIASASDRAASFRSAQRLHRPGEFSVVMTARHVVRGEFFDLHYCPTGTNQAARLGLIVPKRLARAASLRNAIKRQGREAFRLMGAEILPCDLVLRLKRALKGVTGRDDARRKAWRTELESLLRQLPLWSR